MVPLLQCQQYGRWFRGIITSPGGPGPSFSHNMLTGSSSVFGFISGFLFLIHPRPTGLPSIAYWEQRKQTGSVTCNATPLADGDRCSGRSKRAEAGPLSHLIYGRRGTAIHLRVADKTEAQPTYKQLHWAKGFTSQLNQFPQQQKNNCIASLHVKRSPYLTFLCLIPM